MIPFYFGECLAWLHPATGGRGVVICSAQGIEELCTHRFMRHLADEIAAAGMPALRFDYQGTGDSLGNDFDAERVQHWLDSIKQAIACLKRETGVREVALVGFRLGALLAAEVARQLEDVSMLALLAPAVSGKSYLREMRALGMLIARVSASESALQPDSMEVAGFHFTDATIKSLQQLDLLALQQTPARHVLIMGRPAATSDTRLAEHLRNLGSAVEQIEFPGLAELQWDTSFATLPQKAFTTVAYWLARDLPTGSASGSTVHGLARLTGEGWYEEPVHFGADLRLFGIHCNGTNLQTSGPNKVVLFVNHGSNHHIGWARMHVMLSRRFAAQGIASLRMDISGVGDSPAYPTYAENLLYARHSQKDVYAAIDWLQAQGYVAVTVIGHCAGAYLGFYSTLRDVRIKGLVMLNLQRFFWARGDSLEVMSRKGFRSTGWYVAMLRDPQVWRRLLTAKINFSGIVLTLLRRLWQRAYNTAVQTIGPLFGNEGFSRKVVRWLRELSARGTRVLLVYSAEDGGLDEIAAHAGANGKKLRRLSNVELQILDGADHNLTPMWAQQQYAKILDDFLAK